MQKQLFDQVAGAVIAGGVSSRFGSNKALAVLGNATLIEYVYDRLDQQTATTWLNAPADLELPSRLQAIDRITDAIPSAQRQGPLTGVLPCLKKAASAGYSWLLISPCDTPFIPPDLSHRLLESCTQHDCQLAIAQSNGRRHPSVSLWHCSLLEPLEEAVIQQGKGGFKQFFPETAHCFVEWPISRNKDSDHSKGHDPFFNINYSVDLDNALDILKSAPI